MSENNNICEYISQGNINFIIIKNTMKNKSDEENIEEALKLCHKINKYDNLNMNILFINNVIDKDERKDTSSFEKNINEAREIKLKNENVNIILLKNIVKLGSDKDD